MSEWTPWDELEAERKGRWAAEAQRDRAMELLHRSQALMIQMAEYLTLHAQTSLGTLLSRRAFEKVLPDLTAFLAEQEKNDA